MGVRNTLVAIVIASVVLSIASGLQVVDAKTQHTATKKPTIRVTSTTALLTASSPTTSPPTSCNGTAYARQTTGNATCIYPTYSNWGWTNLVSAPGVYQDNIWLGAAHCDVSGRLNSGNATVTYNGTWVTVNYTFVPNVVISVLQFYVGQTMFPLMARCLDLSHIGFNNHG